MFNPFSALTGSVTTKLLLVIAVGITGALGVFYWQYKSQHEELNVAKKDLAVVTVAKTMSDAAAKNLHTAGAISEETRVATNQAVAVIEKKVFIADTEARAREKQVRLEIDELKRKAADEQVVAALDLEQQQKISAVRIAEMWSAFCAGSPGHYKCATAGASK